MVLADMALVGFIICLRARKLGHYHLPPIDVDFLSLQLLEFNVFCCLIRGLYSCFIGTFFPFLCMTFNLNIFCVLLTFSKNELEHVEIRKLDQLMGNTPELVSYLDYAQKI